MRTQNHHPRHHCTKPYHHQQHLLIQFILSELMFAFHEIEEVIKILGNNALDQENEAKQLMSHLMHLSGSTQLYTRLFSWDDNSILTKLRNYCAYFCQRTGKNTERHKMHNEANQSWLLSLRLFDLARFHIGDITRGQNPDNKELYAQLNKLMRSMQRLVRNSAKVIPEFRHDENVVFFLVRHAHALDRLYGEKFVEKLLGKMFPKRAHGNGVEVFLVKKYSERGFKHLEPTIKSKIAVLSIT